MYKGSQILNKRKKDGRNPRQIFSTGTKFLNSELSEKQVVLFEKRCRCTTLLIIDSKKRST
jgi:hypothetical protein